MIPFSSAPAARLASAARANSVRCSSPDALPDAETPVPSPEEEVPSAAHPASALFDMPSPGGRRTLVLALFAILVALTLIAFTESTAPAIRAFVRAFPKSVYATLTQLPSPTTLLAVMAAIWLLDVRRRAALVYLVVALGVSGLVTEPLKQLTGRARPQASVLRTEESPKRMVLLAAEYPAVRPPAHIPGTDRWLFFSSGRPWFADSFSSFPSGHAMSAFVLAAFLCALYPPGRWLWLLLAFGCALARVRARRHFLDDVLFSAGVGWMLAYWVFRWRWPARLAQRVLPSPHETNHSAGL